MAEKIETYAPPASPEAEQSVLGAILVRPEVMDNLVDLLDPVHFYRQAHANIYRAMLGLYNADQPVDLVTVSLRLKEVGMLDSCGGAAFLAGLSEQVGFATNAEYYAQKVKEKYLLRCMLDVSQEIAAGCLAPTEDTYGFIDAAEEKILRVRESQRDRQEALSLDEIIPAEVERIEGIYERKVEVLGVQSGFKELDLITGGWQRSDLIILAARPSMGKTALALNMARFAAGKGETPTLFYSLEQPKEQLALRMLAAEGSINATRLRSARMDGQEWAKLGAAAGNLLDSVQLFIVDRPAMNTVEIRAQAKRMVKRAGIGMIVIDYLQLVKERARSREQEIGGVSRSLKSLAKELNVPVIALAQLNRDVEKRPNKRPMLSDLRESGSIEQDADLVVFIYRDEVYKGADSKEPGVAEVRIAKQRNGPTGLVRLTYLKEFMRFENMAQEKLYADSPRYAD